MYKFKVLMLIFIFQVSCRTKNPNVVIITSRDSNCHTLGELNGFNKHENNLITIHKNDRLLKELKKARKKLKNGYKDHGLLYCYAYVIEKDTIYSTSDFKFWTYKEKILPLKVETVNDSIIASVNPIQKLK